ncbi:hypothetical protein AB0E88_30125 [Streptomyces sp. NPDC028635]|uniref:hypothetical protein n=1 Tax=Streptomyces sp. NPDC028635 TaxID=3154800 RepID=UPI0033FD027D
MTVPQPAPPSPVRSLPRSLLRQVRADPGHLPEHLALFAVRHLAHAAGRRTARLRDQRPDAPLDELRHRVIVRGERTVVAEGAFVGGPVLLLVPFAFCAALLGQARTVLELAALSGRDPASRDRAADLLVLQGVHADTRRAAQALAATERALLGEKRPAAQRTRRAGLWHLTLRMARLLGLLTPATDTRRPAWYVQAGRIALVVLVIAVGMVAPLVWVPYMVVSYRSATRRLLERTDTYYFGPAGGAARPRSRLDPALLLAAGRAVLSLLLPVVVTVTFLFADLRFAGSRWAAAGLAVAAMSVTTGVVWLVHRHRRRREDGDESDGVTRGGR